MCLRVLGVLAFVCVFVTVCSLCLSLLAHGLFSRFPPLMSFVCLSPPNVFCVSLSLSDPSVPDGLALPWQGKAN